MESYPFLDYINEDKSGYIHAKDFKTDVHDPTKNSLTVDDSYWETHEYSTFNDEDDLLYVLFDIQDIIQDEEEQKLAFDRYIKPYIGDKENE